MDVVTYNNGVCNYVAPPLPKKSVGQTRLSGPLQIASGIDKLEVTLNLNISNYEIFERFSFLKNQVQATLAPSIAVNFHSVEFFSWNLQRTGTKLYPYVLRSGDISLLLSTRSHESSIPNCRIEIGSISSQEGAFDIYNKLLQWLKVYGFTVEKEVVSRVDLAVDCIGEPINGTGISLPDRWISRARKFAIYYEDWNLTGIMLGKGRMCLRIYDKARELRKNKVKAKFFHELWDLPTENPESVPVTRVEFQFRRELLKEFAVPVNTVQDLRKNVDSIWQYGCHKWARLSRRSIDRKNNHHQRAVMSSFWRKIQGVVFSFPAPVNKRIRKNLTKNIIALREQARGCLLSVAAAAGHDKDDFFGIIATCVNVMSTDLAEYMADRVTDFERLFDVRRNECYVGFE